MVFNAFYREAEKTAIKKLNDEQIIHARQAALGIEDFFKTWTETLNSFSKMDEIINIDADGKRYIKLFSEAHHEQIRSITRMDEKGTIIHTFPFSRAIGSNISEQKHVKEILRTHKPVISDVFMTVQGFNAVALHVPVFKESVFKGTIAIVVNFEILTKRYLDVIKVGETSDAWVISSEGTQLYSTTPGFAGKSVFENYKAYPSVLAMVSDMLKGHEGIAEYTFDRIGDRTVGQINKYAVYAPIQLGNTFWSIVVSSAEQEVLSGLISFRNRLILVIGVIFLFGIVFSMLGTKAWFIVKEEEKRKQTEDTLRESEEKYRTLVENIPQKIFIKNRHSVYVSCNKNLARDLGIASEEFAGKTDYDFFPKELADKYRSDDMRVMESGETENIEEQYMHNGETVWVYTVKTPIRDKDGNTVGILGVFSDITERKRAEEELREAHDRLLKIVATTPGIVCSFRLRPDGSSCFPYGGERIAEIYGAPPGRLTEDAAPFFSLVHPDDLEGLRESIAESARRLITWRHEWRVLHPVRGDLWIEAQSMPLREPDGSTLWQGVATDITERKKAEEELNNYREHLEEMVKERTAELQDSQRALINLLEDLNQKTAQLASANEKLKEIDRLKSIFIASMSHELRTPLNSVIGFSSILLNEWLGTLNSVQKENLATILKSGKHLLTLINDVIDISKIEAGKIEVRYEDFDLNDLMLDAVKIFQKESRENGLELKFDIPHQIMHTDKRRLFQSILNLLSNAVKFTLKGSVSISSRLTDDGNLIEISVEDTGIGIKQEDLPKLFKPFSRIDTPIAAKVPGTGLGLYLTKKLVTEVLKGDIIIYSEHDRGSNFTIKIPVKAVVSY